MPQSNGNAHANGLASDWREGGANAVSATGRYQMEANEGIDLTQMLRIFQRRWKAMALIFLAVMALSVAYLKTTKRIYQAVATMQIVESSKSAATLPGLEELLSDKSDSSIETQMQLVGGPDVRVAAVKSMTETQRQGMTSPGDVAIDPVGHTNLITIAARAYKPESAAALANAIGLQYEKITLKQNQALDEKRISYVNDELRKIAAQRNAALEKVRDFQQRTGTISSDDKAAGLSTRLASAQAALAQAKADRRAATATIENADATLKKSPDALVPTSVNKNDAVVKLQAQLTDLENEKASLSDEYTSTSYRVQQLDSQINAIRKSLSREADRVVTSWQPNPVVQKRNDAQADIWALDARISALQNQLQSANSELETLPSQQLQLFKLQSESKNQNDRYLSMGATLQTLELGQQAREPDAQIITAAKPNRTPISPNKKKVLTSGFRAGHFGRDCPRFIVGRAGRPFVFRRRSAGASPIFQFWRRCRNSNTPLSKRFWRPATKSRRYWKVFGCCAPTFRFARPTDRSNPLS